MSASLMDVKTVQPIVASKSPMATKDAASNESKTQPVARTPPLQTNASPTNVCVVRIRIVRTHKSVVEMRRKAKVDVSIVSKTTTAKRTPNPTVCTTLVRRVSPNKFAPVSLSMRRPAKKGSRRVKTAETGESVKGMCFVTPAKSVLMKSASLIVQPLPPVTQKKTHARHKQLNFRENSRSAKRTVRVALS